MKLSSHLLLIFGLLLFLEVRVCAKPLTAEELKEYKFQLDQGQRYFETNQLEEAIKCFRLALTLKSNPNVYHNLAQAHLKLRHYREAKEYFDIFLRFPNLNLGDHEKQEVEAILADLEVKIREQDNHKVVLVPQRPKWRIALGVVGMAAGATLVTFGGLFASVHGQPILDNGKEDFTKVYATKTLATGLIVPGAVCLIGGVVLLALPGDLKKSSDDKSPLSPSQTLSLGGVGSGTGLIVRGGF